MARRMNASQFRAALRQLESQRRQAISRYNDRVRQYNQSVRNFQRAIDRYNQEVRAYNSRRRLHLQRLQSEWRRLQSQASGSHARLRTSTIHLHSTYARLESTYGDRPRIGLENLLFDLSEREAANSLGVLNALDSPEDEGGRDSLQQTEITDELAAISEDLDARWKGALFALNPDNPDGARHFCSSAREIFVQILETKAPDEAVFATFPDAQRTERGSATRRSRISYLLSKKGIRQSEFTDFASEDVENVLELFAVLNEGTHREPGHYGAGALSAIKRRVEGGLVFLSRLVL